jgi:choline dehydrogenase-like flavoprotein
MEARAPDFTANNMKTKGARRGELPVHEPSAKERSFKGPSSEKAEGRQVPVGVARGGVVKIPVGINDAEVRVADGTVKLTNLQKVFWPELKLTKRDLLQYYLDVSPWLLPHVRNRAMVMKR